MTNEERLLDLSQQIYVARNNEKNDVTGSDLTNFVDTTIIWVNQFIPELEKETYWNWSRDNDYDGGTVSAGDTSINISDDIRTIVKHPDRKLKLVKDGHIIASFEVVSPNIVKSGANRVALLGRKIIFSRPITANEHGASVVFDAVYFLPTLSRDDVSLLDIVSPTQLLVLGTLKNQVLPDIVQGGLTPSFTQKYADLLEATKYENDLSAEPEDAYGEDLGRLVHGVGF